MKSTGLLKVFLGIIVIAAVVSVGWWGRDIGLPDQMFDSGHMRDWFEALGGWGPIAVIGLMMLAILVSPLPSAPIALTAGAIYGHLWGTLYVLTGSIAGAMAAFAISRFLGYDLMRRWLGPRLTEGLAGSQNFLMLTVFVSRLIPFISFDIVSYAAGLTSLSLWRFALATLAGIVPASFLLAHFGSELVTDEADRILLAVAFLGLLVALPFFGKVWSARRREK